MVVAIPRHLLKMLNISKFPWNIFPRKYNVFGIKDLLQREKPENFSVHPIKSENRETAINIIKKYYLKEHVLTRDRGVDLSGDQAVTEYITRLIQQGNSLLAQTASGSTAGVCVNFAVSPVDPQNLRTYAYYRQVTIKHRLGSDGDYNSCCFACAEPEDPDAKDFLYFAAKLHETPNLWNMFKQIKVFEIKMLAILPEFRRQGLSLMLAEKSIDLAKDVGYKVIRMDCINPYDYKIAESCMLHCLLRFPLHKLRSPTAPFVRRSSECNSYVRVYVRAPTLDTPHLELTHNDDLIE